MDIVTDNTHLLALGTGGLNPSSDDPYAAPYIDGWHIEEFVHVRAVRS